ncbi:MAG TPA: adenylate/guanylate cyclase domain-containing protein [Acidimicrobiia bacterium]
MTAPRLTNDELEALGLYDPAAPDAGDRLEMIGLALDHGATIDEIRTAIAEKRLHAVPAELVIAPGSERLTLDEVVARAGVDPDFARHVWRALGFVVPEPGTRLCSEADVALMTFYELASAAFGRAPALSLARTTGASMARLADGAITNARSVLEAPLRSEGGSNADIARTFVAVAEQVIPAVYPMLETVHRRHLVAAARRYAAWGVEPTSQHTSDAVVGFADVVGYTSLTQRISADDLERLVVGFEERALAATARPGARLVKTIGDEVMFVAGDAADAVEIARALVCDEALPALRIGLAAGEVVTRDGDLYGPVVNLAARLVATAAPEQIVVDAETARRLGNGVTIESLGTRRLQGFDDPVEVYGLRPSR